jgi:hypothetical protein
VGGVVSVCSIGPMTGPRRPTIREAIEQLVCREPGQLTKSAVVWRVMRRRAAVFETLASMLEAGTLSLGPDPCYPKRRVLFPVRRFPHGSDTVPGGR